VALLRVTCVRIVRIRIVRFTRSRITLSLSPKYRPYRERRNVPLVPVSEAALHPPVHVILAGFVVHYHQRTLVHTERTVR